MSLESPSQGPANPFWWNWYTWWTLLQFYYLRWPYADGLTYLLGSLTVNPDCESDSPAHLVFFLSSDAGIRRCDGFPFIGKFWSCCHSFHGLSARVKRWYPFSSHSVCMTILALIGTVFVIIWEMFLGMISWSSVLLFFQVNFVSEFRLELTYISLIVSISSSLNYEP